MKSEAHWYTIEKLTNAVEILATGPGDVRERLVSAYLACVILNEDDFPLEQRKDWRWIVEEVTKYGPLTDYEGKIWRGSVENTMRRSRNSRARKIARKMWDVYWAVSKNTLYE